MQSFGLASSSAAAVPASRTVPLVLVADDDEDILTLVALRFRRSGLEVILARDGEEAGALAVAAGCAAGCDGERHRNRARPRRARRALRRSGAALPRHRQPHLERLEVTEPGGHVCVRTSHHANVGVIEVSDGMGMSGEDHNQLFERFFRTASATDQAIQGTGLGLAIVKAIVEAHDGVITVESVEGVGTVFRVEFPLTAVRQPVAA